MRADQPKVTIADIEAAIESAHYFTAADGVMGELASDGVVPTAYERANLPQTLSLLTICVLILDNGIKAIGYSACVDPAEFDQAKGREYARKMALDQLWMLLGMRLADLKHQRAQAERVVAAMDAEDARLA